MTGLRMLIDKRVEFDSVVCYNDQTALEIIRVLNQCGKKVPEDVSVTGYDNSVIAENGPVKLTTISHPKEALGEMAAQLLLEKINGVSENESKVARVVEPTMLIRESCRDRRIE
jgi:GntR family transcriptional regulator of arabinose operon